ncbi:hypothetical protein BIV25_15220 [Streptomyces sp. MUSC 14]|nr:hypothetical protein BIV25_15220 [Streptomyces sp. MUSC 14]
MRLTGTAERAQAAGIAAAAPGSRVGGIGHAAGEVCRAAGYGIPQGFGGHGVGCRMHEDPEVPNGGRAGRGLPPRTRDCSRAAHAEHTVAITETGPRFAPRGARGCRQGRRYG